MDSPDTGAPAVDDQETREAPEGCDVSQAPAPAPSLKGSLDRGEKLSAEKLGLRVLGSAAEGHEIRTREGSLQKIFGTDEPFQANAFLTHCLGVLHPDEAGNAGEHNDQRPFVISIVKDIGARDAVERMLAVQMAATHVAMIRAARSLARADILPRIEAHSTNYNKLARTFTAQMEALRKHRNGGRQKVTVEHVHVHPGGQAVVGEVHHGGGGWPMKDDDNPMNPVGKAGLQAAPRCRAHSKRTGEPCRAPAVTGWRVCRMHGAGGGHAAGPAHPRWTHGMRSRQWTEMRRATAELVRKAREIEAMIG